jgi:metal iron transporter
MSDHPSLASQPSSGSLNTPSPPRKWAREAWIHLTKHVGIGIICSVAYFDPYVSLFSCPSSPQSGSVAFASRGNWGVDLQAGSDFGYKLLFVVLLAGLFAVILQVTFFVSVPRCYVILIRLLKGLSCKLGVVTGLGKRVSLKHAFPLS